MIHNSKEDPEIIRVIYSSKKHSDRAQIIRSSEEEPELAWVMWITNAVQGWLVARDVLCKTGLYLYLRAVVYGYVVVVVENGEGRQRIGRLTQVDPSNPQIRANVDGHPNDSQHNTERNGWPQ